MNKIIVATLCLGLACCAQVAVTATRAYVPPEYVQKIETVCRDGRPVLSAASSLLNPSTTAREIAGYAGAYCGLIAAGSIPSTTDANTVAWLTQNIGTLRALAR